MAYIVDPVVFENFSELALNEICTALMGTLLYGIFFVLFLLAMHLLYHRRTAGRITLVVLTVAMGLMATAQFSLHLASTALAMRLLEAAVVSGDLPVNSSVETLQLALGWAEDILLVTNTVITDGLFVRAFLSPLLVRAFSDGDAGVSLLPRLGPAEKDVPFDSAPSHDSHARAHTPTAAATPAATGYVTSYDQDYSNGPAHLDPRIVFTLNLFTNLLLMLLTAGRIWWATRGTRDILSPSGVRLPRYSAAISIILESGAIYCCGIVFQVVALSVQDRQPIPVYLSHGTIGQLVNIAPMLIIVRVGLGHTTPTTMTVRGAARATATATRSLAFAPAASETARGCGSSLDEGGVQLTDIGVATVCDKPF
ncbi:hypothetical protein GGX14DRAFT_644611 [Mycena pura]|uniref:Uncharacterized protein n=1 Tax=Mycena pura TaxID=153505 RepID=A0AAD6V8G7_9AGAR|nr:hypothetical protein GGX14DRAFT_644611 [Mycena pura]